MKLSKETVAILKNFAQLNENLMCRVGNTISTLNAQKTIFAEASIAESFPMDFGIYSLSEFLGALNLFDTAPTLDFSEKYLTISDGESQVKFYYAAENVLLYPQKKITFPAADYSFTVKESDLSRIMKSAATLRANDVKFVGSDGNISAVVADKNNPTSNAFNINLGKHTGESDSFGAYLKLDNMKLMSGQYRVSISKRKISEFISEDGNLKYLIAVESDSPL